MQDRTGHSRRLFGVSDLSAPRTLIASGRNQHPLAGKRILTRVTHLREARHPNPSIVAPKASITKPQ